MTLSLDAATQSSQDPEIDQPWESCLALHMHNSFKFINQVVCSLINNEKDKHRVDLTLILVQRSLSLCGTESK